MSTDGQPAAQLADPGRIEQILTRIREHGGRRTPVRRLLVTILLERPGHHSAEELAAAVHARAPDVHLSTIYRHLDELEQLDIIDRTRASHGPATYHLAATDHGHLACDNCGTITEVPASLFTHLTDLVQAGYGFTINPHQLTITGHCASCQL
ncbi:MAG TPA: Fur family transcriptional regulator [Streptosporangiaceae bacterium]|nr:Fur family transcriptional regulator [Streptosporangiaceae bacterium]